MFFFSGKYAKMLLNLDKNLRYSLPAPFVALVLGMEPRKLHIFKACALPLRPNLRPEMYVFCHKGNTCICVGGKF